MEYTVEKCNLNKLYSVDDVITDILPLGKSTVYKYIAQGKIKCICFGRRKFISGETLSQLLKVGIS